MPNMDGTGPRWGGRFAGCGYGRGYGMRTPGYGYGYGFGPGLGYCRYNGLEPREALEAEKSFLAQRLADVEKQLETK